MNASILPNPAECAKADQLPRGAAQTIGRLPPRCAAISAGGVERVVELVQVPAQSTRVVGGSGTPPVLG